MNNIKQKKVKITKPCTNCFSPKYIKFNFSFITFDKSDKEDRMQLIQRLIEISSEPYLVVANWRKEIGFENVKVDISKEISPKFEDGNRKFDGKYTIMRLYTNNNPYPRKNYRKINQPYFLYILHRP